MPQYLYKIQPVRPAMLSDGPTDDEMRLTGEHFAYLQRLTKEGVVILAGRTQDTGYASFGLVIFNADDDAAAHAIVQNDPVVKERVMRAEVYPYAIALHEPNNAN